MKKIMIGCYCTRVEIRFHLAYFLNGGVASFLVITESWTDHRYSMGATPFHSATQRGVSLYDRGSSYISIESDIAVQTSGETIESSYNGPMDKSKKMDIVREVARQAGVSQADAQTIVDNVLDSLVSSLRQGEGVELRGFGTFRFRQRASRRGRNPKTGAEVDIPARLDICFNPGRELVKLLNDASKPGDD